MFTRINQFGLTFYLFPEADGTTRIVHDGKKMVFPHRSDKISMAWFQWQQGGKFIQDAFDFLTPAEREFLKTGITPDEWSAIFKPLEEV